MPSWNIPALINKISEDVPGLKGLLTALIKWTDADTTDVPIGGKRLESVTGGRQIQEKTSSGWASVGKLMHDVDQLDGWHAAQSALANHIAVRDSNGKLAGDVLGNADTATTASGLAASTVVPIANGGTGATTAANARANLGANNAANITTGTLAAARGGTGRTDGKVTDVHLTDYNTGAVGVGQLGPAAAKSGVSCDSLTVPGKYYCSGCTAALKYPSSSNHFVEVVRSGTQITQTAWTNDVLQRYRRTSANSGSTWSGWIPDDYSTAADVNIYISKGGADTNIGMSSNQPVQTVSRALQIARGVKADGALRFCFGPGEWGNVTLDQANYQCSYVKVTNYANSGASTAAAFAALTGSGSTGNQPPAFDTLTLRNGAFAVGNITVDKLATWGVSSLLKDYFTASAVETNNYQVGLGVDTGGNVISYVPTPPANDDSKKIANTEWVNDRTDQCIKSISSTDGNIVYTKGDGTTQSVAVDNNTPIGTVIWSASKTPPAGFLLCDGSAVSRDAYPDLFTAIGTTFGAGDGSLTFNLPNLIDRFAEGADGNGVGTFLQAGVPNVSGRLAVDGIYGSDVFTWADGCMSLSGHTGWRTSTLQYNYDGAGGVLALDASRNSTVYGRSNTVQPPALKLLPCIKAFYGQSITQTQELSIQEAINNMITQFNELSAVVNSIGTITYFSGSTIPQKHLLCNGQAVSRTEYSALFSIIGTTYGTGDDSTTFNVPNLIDRFPQGGTTPGIVKAAGLPNITGHKTFRDASMHNASGGALSFSIDSGQESLNKYAYNGKISAFQTLYFNAAWSNSIYGNSNTVQPPALTLQPIIRALL